MLFCKAKRAQTVVDLVLFVTKPALDTERWTLFGNEEKEREEVRVMDSEPAKKLPISSNP